MERIATTGILGFISWLAVAFVFIVTLLKTSVGSNLQIGARMQTEHNHNSAPVRDWSQRVLVPLFLGWFVLFIFQFLYLSNTTLNFCFWLFIGIGMTYVGSRVYLEE